MVCARFGSPSLTARVKGISVFNALVSLLSTIFGIVGCASYTNSQDNISRAPWHVTYINFKTGDLDAKAYMGWGIQSYLKWTQVTGGEKSFGWTLYKSTDNNAEPVPYAAVKLVNDVLVAAGAQPTESTDYATACDKASKGVVTLCSLALICCFVAFICHLLRACCDSTFAKDLSVLGGTVAFILGIISYSIYTPCSNAINAYFIQLMTDEKIAVDKYSYGYGIGSAVVAACFGMMIWTSLVSLIIPVAEAEKTPVPTGEVTKV